MKKIITAVFCLGVGATGLVGCTNTEVGTTTGAAAGAGLGYAVSGGSAGGTLLGAGTGALLGYAVGQSQDNYYYRNAYYGYGGYHPYYRNGYYGRTYGYRGYRAAYHDGYHGAYNRTAYHGWHGRR